MRRVLLAVVAGGLLMTAACSADEPDGAAAPAASSPASAAASSAAAPAGPDYTADTKKVCANVMKVIETDMNGFGTAIGKMIANKEAKSTAEAKEAQATARKELETVARKIRSSSAKAQDPELVAAGKQTADSIAQTARDAKFYNDIKSVESINGTLQEEMISWVEPLAPICG